MILFRIEDISGVTPNSREYNIDEFTNYLIDKSKVDEYIAGEIRKEINGSKDRKLLSYSKSLATCILKYNIYTDDELHIYNTNTNILNYILYYNSFPKDNNEELYYSHYSIQERINEKSLFNESGKIYLYNFVIDVSDNNSLNKYLKSYTETGIKAFASPEKDSEVIVLNPLNDLVINQYMEAVYILYALQLKYKFLNNIPTDPLIYELNNIPEDRFVGCLQEREAFKQLILYLSNNWKYEYDISKNIYTYLNNENFIRSTDPIWHFKNIIKNDFEESYGDFEYHSSNDIISNLFWKYCKELYYKY